jgi:ABC-type glutathione transport system ATPase component
LKGLVLEVRDLRVVHPKPWSRRGGFVAVDGVSLSLRRGEVVGLVGESGSGKTTVAMAAAGLGRVTSGLIRVRGKELTAMRGRKLRRFRTEVQVVFQDPHGSLDPRQSVRSGLTELRKLHRERTSWTTDEQLMARVGLGSEILDRLPNEISGGQAQRVSIARALLLRPSLLVADEPTSALDVSIQAQILELLRSLSRAEGVAILFISHDLSVVRQLCQRVVVMRSGAVVEEGLMEAVASDPRHEYTRALIEALPGKGFMDAVDSVTGHGVPDGTTTTTTTVGTSTDVPVIDEEVTS